VRVASSVLVPEGLDANLWRDLSPEERFYLRGLEIEMHGEYRAGAYSELAKGFGVKEYKSFQAVTKANQTRLKNASEFASRAIEPMGKDKTFACSQLRHLLYAIFVTADTLNAEAGKAYLRENVTGYWQRRALFIDLLTYLHKLSALPHHKKRCRSRMAAGDSASRRQRLMVSRFSSRLASLDQSFLNRELREATEIYTHLRLFFALDSRSRGRSARNRARADFHGLQLACYMARR
jgi:hypothetical protein